MVRDINGPGAKPPTTPTTGEQTQLRTQREGSTQQPAAAAPQSAPAGKAAADSVNLSSNAVALKALEEKIQRLPEINEKRVAEIKAALASGSYKVDDLVVADKLLGIDELFGDERPA
jgi:negative regulator of flagellin synthesis FlgM